MLAVEDQCIQEPLDCSNGRVDTVTGRSRAKMRSANMLSVDSGIFTRQAGSPDSYKKKKLSMRHSICTSLTFPSKSRSSLAGAWRALRLAYTSIQATPRSSGTGARTRVKGPRHSFAHAYNPPAPLRRHEQVLVRSPCSDVTLVLFSLLIPRLQSS